MVIASRVSISFANLRNSANGSINDVSLNPHDIGNLPGCFAAVFQFHDLLVLFLRKSTRCQSNVIRKCSAFRSVFNVLRNGMHAVTVKQLHVVYIVVQTILVNVVNRFRRFQAATYVRFHDESVFGHISELCAIRMRRTIDIPISIAKILTALPFRIARSNFADVVTSGGTVDQLLRSGCVIRSLANFTNTGNWHVCISTDY